VVHVRTSGAVASGEWCFKVHTSARLRNVISSLRCHSTLYDRSPDDRFSRPGGGNQLHLHHWQGSLAAIPRGAAPTPAQSCVLLAKVTLAQRGPLSGGDDFRRWAWAVIL